MWEKLRGSAKSRKQGIFRSFENRAEFFPVLCLGAVLAIAITPVSASAKIEPATLQRNLEPVLIYGSSLKNTGFDSVGIDSIHAFVYSSETGTWKAIPFQIDEVNEGDFFTPDDGILDSNDQLVLYSADLGDSVSDGIWLSDSLSRAFPRIEIEVCDTLSGENKGWAYLYLYAPDSVTANITPYVTYDSYSDRVLGRYYTIGHNSEGLVVIASITHDGGGQNIDIVDRQKLRVKGNYTEYWIPFNYSITEDNIKKEGIDWVAGPVRVLRKLRAKIVYSVAEEEVSFTSTFYARSLYAKGSGDFDSGWGVYHLRQSTDLNSNARGMLFFNPLNDSIVIDTGRDDVNPQLNVPGKNWVMVTGNQGTIVTLVDVPDIGDVQKLYYRDYPSGTSDGTTDTGDGHSYGDIGVYAFTTNDRIMTGSFSTATWMYFLPANQPKALGDTLLSNWENPMKLAIHPQWIDSVGPARIADLLASAYAKGAVQLTWTAPGDDGNEGQAERYDVRYTLKPPPIDSFVQAVLGMGNDDIDDWFDRATPLSDTTAPQPAGTKETRIVEELTIGKRYYFAVRTYDDAKFASPVSNVASVMVVPVELTIFTARARGDSVVLDWTTVTESDNLGFAVERSTDGSQFQEIAFLPGSGTTTETKRYHYTDHPAKPGRYFYRLRQMDADGSYALSQQKSVTLEPEDFLLLVAYPSPFNAQTRLHFRLLGGEEAQILIYDALGRRVQQFELSGAEAGVHELLWDGRDQLGRALPSGVYVVRLAGKTYTITTKVLLVR